MKAYDNKPVLFPCRCTLNKKFKFLQRIATCKTHDRFLFLN